jgi:hypothetical protein
MRIKQHVRCNLPRENDLVSNQFKDGEEEGLKLSTNMLIKYEIQTSFLSLLVGWVTCIPAEACLSVTASETRCQFAAASKDLQHLDRPRCP